MSKETKEVAIKNSNAMAQYGDVDIGLLSELSSAEATDFEFARLTVVQPTSKIEGTWGDVIDSNTNQPIVKMNEQFAIVPLWFFKSYAVVQQKPQRKWLRNETKVAANAARSMFDNRETTEDIGGKQVPVKWEERINLYLILAKDLNEQIPTVYRLLIKPSSFKEAKKLLMDWEIKKKCGQYPFTFQWKLKPTPQENEQGKFAAFEVVKDTAEGKQIQITPEQFKGVEYWVKTLVANRDQIMKVESKLAEEAEEVSTSGIKY